MPTKAELTQDIYLLLAVAHLNGFVMSPKMAQRILDRWPTVMGPRPESPKAIIDNYNTILQQTPAETIKTPKVQDTIKNERNDSPFSLARSKKSTTTSRMPKLKSAKHCKKESSTESTLPTTLASNKEIEVIDLTDEIEDQETSLPNVYPTRKRLCPLDFTTHLEVKKEEYGSGVDDKISDEFVTSLLDKTPSKKPKMEYR
ncbi:hypothetical protein QM012_008577 [Aureobasidium pullulans]|uniref:Uncharacterized protein n=1 Tax=Aureobasidium pullulans TaxID=5580 RepID=A0ABR0TLE6_AURPU